MMSMQVLVVVMVLAGTASVFWFAKRQPSRQQTFSAVAAIVASIFIMAVPRFQATAWFYMAAVIGTIAVTFLFTMWLRRSPQHGTR
jgi:hypothetical protein